MLLESWGSHPISQEDEQMGRGPAWGSALCAGCQDPSKDALCAEYNGLDIQELNLCHLDGEYTSSYTP